MIQVAIWNQRKEGQGGSGLESQQFRRDIKQDERQQINWFGSQVRLCDRAVDIGSEQMIYMYRVPMDISREFPQNIRCAQQVVLGS